MTTAQLVFLFFLSFSVAISQTYDPETGEEIQPEAPAFDPETGMPVEEEAEPEMVEPEVEEVGKRSMTISKEELRRIIREEIDGVLKSPPSSTSVDPGLRGRSGGWHRGVPSNGEEGIIVDNAGKKINVKLYGFDGTVVKYKLRGESYEYRYRINSISRIHLADGTLVYSAQNDGGLNGQSSPGGLSINQILGICCAGIVGLLLLGAIV